MIRPEALRLDLIDSYQELHFLFVQNIEKLTELELFQNKVVGDSDYGIILIQKIMQVNEGQDNYVFVLSNYLVGEKHIIDTTFVREGKITYWSTTVNSSVYSIAENGTYSILKHLSLVELVNCYWSLCQLNQILSLFFNE